MKFDTTHLSVKLAETDAERKAAQRLRYRVFVQEMGASSDPDGHQSKLETDVYDPYFDHLILIDETISDPLENVVGVYRVMREDQARDGLGFYGAPEYNLSKLQTSGRKLLELGRSCIHADYRGGVALYLMWNGLAEYVLEHDIEVLFGVASFSGTNPNELKDALSFLHHFHMAPTDLCVQVRSDNAIKMDLLPAERVDKLRALRQLPPLIKAYLRLGGFVGSGAYLDRAFNTVDVCLLMDTKRMSAKHKAYYEKGVA